jgi:DNA replication protein DnaC
MSDRAPALAALGLRYPAAHLDDVVALATKRRWSPTQLLEHLAESEQQERARRSLERRLLRSRLGRFTPMSEFDWAWPKRIDRPAVEAALRLDFLPAARNVVLVAPQGLGKTMIAQNIAHAAVLAGTHVLFKTAAELLLDLGAQESARALGRRLNYYATRGLLVIDEIGYLSYDGRAADLLFQVVSRRYERRSLVLTTNLPFSDWPTIFPNAATATALIDRVVHHAEILSIEGESYRRRRSRSRPQQGRVADRRRLVQNSAVSQVRQHP